MNKWKKLYINTVKKIKKYFLLLVVLTDLYLLTDTNACWPVQIHRGFYVHIFCRAPWVLVFHPPVTFNFLAQPFIVLVGRQLNVLCRLKKQPKGKRQRNSTSAAIVQLQSVWCAAQTYKTKGCKAELMSDGSCQKCLPAKCGHCKVFIIPHSKAYGVKWDSNMYRIALKEYLDCWSQIVWL